MSTSEHLRHQRVAIERADALFERRTIPEIHAIEKATENQIQEKKTKLRELVGASYKEVILSSDAILHMSEQSSSVQTRLDQIRQTLAPDTFIRQDTLLGRKERLLEAELQLIGSRVKYLVDSQEVIWTALDSKDFLEASRRLLRGQIVQESLQDDELVAKRFPFLQHCWKATEQLRGPIIDRLRQQMIAGSNPENTAQTISCLTAFATLEGHSSMELLSAFLQFRKLSIVSFSTSYSLASQTVESLSRIGRLVQETLSQALELFVKSGPLSEEGCLIQETVKDDGIGFSGLLFSAESPKSEEESWSVRLRSIFENLGPLDSSILTAELQDWFQEVSKVVQDAGSGLLLSCGSLKSLKNLEGEVKESLKREESWTEALMDQLGPGFEIWKGLFESIVQNKSLELVEEAFQGACQTLMVTLDSKIENLASMELEPLGKVSTKQWSLNCELTEDLKMKVSNLDLNLSSQGSPQLRSYPLEIVRSFDQELSAVLEQILELLGDKEEGSLEAGEDESPKSELSTHRGGSLRSFSLISGSRPIQSIHQRSLRSRELEPKIQTLWEKTAFQLANDLDAKMSQFGVLGGEVQVLESVILMSEISLGIAENCQSLTVLSGPSEEWRSELYSQSIHGSIIAPSSARARPKDLDHSTKTLANAFRKVAFQGITQWTDWTAGALGEVWKEAIGSEQISGTEHQEEIVISHQLEAEFPNQEDQMKFMIPTAPSEVTVGILRKASIELQRLGSFSTHLQIIHLFQFALEKEFRNQLRSLMKELVIMENSEQKLDAFVLQLMIDFRFLCDLCSTGEPVAPFEVDQNREQSIRTLLSVPEDTISLHDQTQKQDPEIKRLIQDSKQQSKSLEQDLSAFLDPIDWATYEPHLWIAEGRFFKRTAVLFGSLLQLSKDLHSDVDIKPPIGSANNSLNSAEVIPRLQYLPVRSFAAEFNKTVRVGVNPGEKSVQFEALDLEQDPLGNFSFADLGITTSSSSNLNEDSTEVSLLFSDF